MSLWSWKPMKSGIQEERNLKDREIIDYLDSLYPKLPHSIGYEKGIFTEVYPKPKEGEDMKKRRWR